MYNYHTLEERTGTSKKLKGESKTVIKNDIKFEDCLKTLTTNKLVKNEVVSIRSLNHQLYTLNQPKIALTSFYDKCCLLNEVDCTTFGYLGNG
jgi:anaerobic ribonucleoside-triphosphate reductase